MLQERLMFRYIDNSSCTRQMSIFKQLLHHVQQASNVSEQLPCRTTH